MIDHTDRWWPAYTSTPSTRAATCTRPPQRRSIPGSAACPVPPSCPAPARDTILACESPAIDEGRATDEARVRGRPLRDDLDGQPAERPYPGGIPEATVARLPIYLRALYTLAERGVSTVASDELADGRRRQLRQTS